MPTYRRRAVSPGTQFVRREDVAKSIPCGPDLDAIVDAVRPYWEAGFTDVALVQIGGDAQELFFKEAAEPLLAALGRPRTDSTFGSVLPGYTVRNWPGGFHPTCDRDRVSRRPAKQL